MQESKRMFGWKLRSGFAHQPANLLSSCGTHPGRPERRHTAAALAWSFWLIPTGRIHSVDQLNVKALRFQKSKYHQKPSKSQAKAKENKKKSFQQCSSPGLASSSQGAKGPKAALRTQSAPVSGDTLTDPCSDFKATPKEEIVFLLTFNTWWLIPLSKWTNPTWPFCNQGYSLSGMNHQVLMTLSFLCFLCWITSGRFLWWCSCQL